MFSQHQRVMIGMHCIHWVATNFRGINNDPRCHWECGGARLSIWIRHVKQPTKAGSAKVMWIRPCVLLESIGRGFEWGHSQRRLAEAFRLKVFACYVVVYACMFIKFATSLSLIPSPFSLLSSLLVSLLYEWIHVCTNIHVSCIAQACALRLASQHCCRYAHMYIIL